VTHRAGTIDKASQEACPAASEIRGLEFKGKFRRFGICSVSTTIGSNRSIFVCSPPTRPQPRFLKRPSQAIRREIDIEAPLSSFALRVDVSQSA
jgi:hypothetical protein